MSYFMSLNPLSLFRAMPGSIAQGMIWGVMALGVYITFRLLDFADLTVDGSIATGAIRYADSCGSFSYSYAAHCFPGRSIGRHGNGTVEHRTGNPRNSGKYSDADLPVFH